MAGSGITFLRAHDADIPTPAPGKVTVFFSIEQAGPAYKDAAGLVFPLEGPTGVQGPAGVPGYAEDGLAGESYPIVAVGPQGNQGLQGDPGSMGMTLFDNENYEPRMIEAIFPPIEYFSQCFTARLELTEAQLEGMPTVVVPIIPAAGPNTIIFPVHWAVHTDVTTGYGNSPSIGLRYGSNATVLITAITPTFSSIAKKVTTNISVAYTLTYTTFDPRNQPVNVTLSAALTSPGTGVATAIVVVSYYIGVMKA